MEKYWETQANVQEVSQTTTDLHIFKHLTSVTERKNVQKQFVREPYIDFADVYGKFIPGVRDVWEKIQKHLYKNFQKGSIDNGTDFLF